MDSTSLTCPKPGTYRRSTSCGFFFVLLAEAVLFTEANVVIPATLLDSREAPAAVARFWALAFLGNFLGAVTLFVAANFQHSPANMGYFSLLMLESDGPGWTAAFAWNLVPAGIGNLLGGTLLVALPFWYAFRAFLSGDGA